MKIYKYIVSLRPALNVAFVIAILSILVMEAWLNNVPEIVSWGSEFGSVYYKICLSIISGYFFYFIVVHVKNVQDKENIGLFLSTKVRNILRFHELQIEDLKKAANNTNSETYLNKSEIEAIFSSINPQSQSPLIPVPSINKLNWMQYFDYYKSRTQIFIQKIFVNMPFLESKLVSLLANIDDCSHFMSIEFIENFHWQVGNTHMSAWAPDFYDYCVLCKELDNYYHQHLEQVK
jgi:hypothetical protein